MTAWSAWTEPFAVPAGALDVYQSLQHLSPRACVASHYHEGPENGLVVSGRVMRCEAPGGQRDLPVATSFVTPAFLAHVTGNSTTEDAEQITLHILPRGAIFAHPSTLAGFPPEVAGSSSRARMCFPMAGLGYVVRARHALVAEHGEFCLPASDDATFVTVVNGELAVGDHRLKTGEGWCVAQRSAGSLVRGSGFAIMSEVRSSS